MCVTLLVAEIDGMTAIDNYFTEHPSLFGGAVVLPDTLMT